jgi:plastocyanin domain-containing protein
MSIRRPLFALSLLLAPLGAAPLLFGAARAEAEEQREIEIVVDHGYQPSRIVVTEGERVRLKLLRKDYSPCAREIVFPSLGIRRELPVNEVVTVDLPTLSPGEIPFHCGMNMLYGTIVVEPRR